MSATTISLPSFQRAGLLADARRGNREAFEELVLPYAPGMYRRALRITGNAADAEDVRQEAMLKAMSRLEQFSGRQEEERDDLQAWVGRIAANASIDLIRQRRENKLSSLEQHIGMGEETLGSNIAAREENPEERFARREMRLLFAEAIKQLPADLRQVCLLRDVLQYTTQEVAERLGVSTLAVRLRLFRAHRRLREKMERALRPATRQNIRTQTASSGTRRPPARRREAFLTVGVVADFACGD
jgi:RNA polymerase sigma-70 factor (ECF subfamily)